MPRPWVLWAQDSSFQLFPGAIQSLNPDSGPGKEVVSRSERSLEAKRDSDQQRTRNSVKGGCVPSVGWDSRVCVCGGGGDRVDDSRALGQNGEKDHCYGPHN